VITMLSSANTMRLSRGDGPAVARRVEGPSSLARTIALTTRGPLGQAILVGVLLAGGLKWIGGVVGVAMTASDVLVISVAAAAAFWFMRGVLGVGFWVALPCSLIWLCHPLQLGSIIGISASAACWPVLLVPVVFAVAGGAAARFGLRGGVFLGLTLGGALAVTGRGGVILVALAAVFTAYGVMAAHQPSRQPISWKTYALGMLIVIVVATFVALALPGVAGQFGAVLPVQGTAAIGSNAATAPFAWVDRTGLLASRLPVLPEDLRAGGGSLYLGWSMVALCLIAVWPRAADSSHRGAALLITLAFTALWFACGTESLHAQLVRMFEFATLKRYVEPATLQILGLMTVPLAILILVLFLAVGGLSRRRWTFVSVIAAAATVLLSWAVTPADVLPTSIAQSNAPQNSALLRPLVAFLFVSGAAAGLQRLLDATTTSPRRLVVWMIVLALMAVDIQPYADIATERHSSGCTRSDTRVASKIGTG
jgi:hypothetical protein